MDVRMDRVRDTNNKNFPISHEPFLIILPKRDLSASASRSWKIGTWPRCAPLGVGTIFDIVLLNVLHI
jgi:hypothetical protein